MPINIKYAKVVDYILYQIYTDKWMPGERIFTAQQLVNKLDVDLQIVKKCLSKFEHKKILISKERVGYFVNQDLFYIYPLSIRHKYNLEIGETSVTNATPSINQGYNDHLTIVKHYVDKNNVVKVTVNSSCNVNFFSIRPYAPKLTFMANLAVNGMIIRKIKTVSCGTKTNSIKETREFYTRDGKLVASEIINIDLDIWNQEVDLML